MVARPAAPLRTVTLNVPVFEPAGTVTVAGTEMAVELLFARLTTTPCEGAVFERTTDQVAVLPLVAVAGPESEVTVQPYTWLATNRPLSAVATSMVATP